MTARLFPYGVILILVGIIILQNQCHKPASCPVIKSDTLWKVQHDTSYKDKPVPYEVLKDGKPYPVYVYDTVHDTIQGKIDTPAAVADYQLRRLYSDTAKTKYGNVIVNNEVTQNKLDRQRIITNLSIPEVHQTVVQRRFQVFGGFGIGSNGNTLGFGPRINALTKDDHLYGIGADYMPGLSNPIYYKISTLWLIKLKPR